MESQHDKRRPDDADKLERGVAENERMNDVPLSREKTERERRKDDDSTIRQTNDIEETDSVGGGGDLAGNAAGNPDVEEEDD